MTYFQLLKSGSGYLSEKQQLRIQVEWDETLLLFQATYHKYDDVGRMHNYQMRCHSFGSFNALTAMRIAIFSLSLSCCVTQEGDCSVAIRELQSGTSTV